MKIRSLLLSFFCALFLGCALKMLEPVAQDLVSINPFLPRAHSMACAALRLGSLFLLPLIVGVSLLVGHRLFSQRTLFASLGGLALIGLAACLPLSSPLFVAYLSVTSVALLGGAFYVYWADSLGRVTPKGAVWALPILLIAYSVGGNFGVVLSLPLRDLESPLLLTPGLLAFAFAFVAVGLVCFLGNGRSSNLQRESDKGAKAIPLAGIASVSLAYWLSHALIRTKLVLALKALPGKEAYFQHMHQVAGVQFAGSILLFVVLILFAACARFAPRAFRQGAMGLLLCGSLGFLIAAICIPSPSLHLVWQGTSFLLSGLWYLWLLWSLALLPSRLHLPSLVITGLVVKGRHLVLPLIGMEVVQSSAWAALFVLLFAGGLYLLRERRSVELTQL